MRNRVIYALFAFSGFAGLIYEAIWARYLKLLFGHSSYGQILTLMVYMAGLGLGAYGVGHWMKHVRRPFLLYASLELLIGLGGWTYHSLHLLSSGYVFDLAAKHSLSPPALAKPEADGRFGDDLALGDFSGRYVSGSDGGLDALRQRPWAAGFALDVFYQFSGGSSGHALRLLLFLACAGNGGHFASGECSKSASGTEFCFALPALGSPKS